MVAPQSKLAQRREQRLARLAAVRAELLATVRPLDDAVCRFQPGGPRSDGEWSVAEILLHLAKVESAIGKGLEAAARGEGPPCVSWITRLLHFPPRWVEYRFPKMSAPRRVRPDEILPKEELLGRLTALRERLLQAVASMPDEKLIHYRFPHPFLGTYNLLERIEILGAHECRHLKQIREVLARAGRDAGR